MESLHFTIVGEDYEIELHPDFMRKSSLNSHELVRLEQSLQERIDSHDFIHPEHFSRERFAPKLVECVNIIISLYCNRIALNWGEQQ